MPEPVRFVAIGDVMVDVTVSGAGHDARIRLAPGGTATNAALSASRAGADATILGRIGRDVTGRMLERELAASGLAAVLGVDPTRPTGTFVVVDGEIHADRGANAGFLAEHLPETFDADVTLVSGYLPEKAVAAALERSRAPWNALAAAGVRALSAGGNAVFLNESEAAALTGARPLEAAHMLGERYRLACVTLGAEGVIAVLDGALETARPETRIPGDGPGGGDALAATVLVALARGGTVRTALSEGLEAAALTLSGGLRRSR